MSPIDCTAVDLEKAPRLYHGWHPGGSKVAGSEASIRPPLCTYHSRSRTSRLVTTSKDISRWSIEAVAESYDSAPTHPPPMVLSHPSRSRGAEKMGYHRTSQQHTPYNASAQFKNILVLI